MNALHSHMLPIAVDEMWPDQLPRPLQVEGFHVFIFQSHLGKEWELADIESLGFNSGIKTEREVRKMQGRERGRYDMGGELDNLPTVLVRLSLVPHTNGLLF